MIIVFGTYDASRHPRVGILADGLRLRGKSVVECNRPLGFSTAERVRMLKQPWRLPLLAVRLLLCWAGLTKDVARARRTGPVEGVLVGYMGHFDVLLARLLFPKSIVMLDHLIFASGTARDRGTGSGMRTRALDLLDRLAVRSADLVIVDTNEHASLVPGSRPRVVVPVGARAEWSAAADNGESKSADRPLTLVFFGLFTPLQGAPTMAAGLSVALTSGAALKATIIGSGQDLAECQRLLAGRTEITWHEWVDPTDLPALVAQHDVCLGIFGSTEKAQNVVPNKVYQGLAAGCVVVTSDTPPQRRLLGDSVELVPPSDSHALAQKLMALSSDPEALRLAQLRAATGSTRFSSESVVESLLERFDQLRSERETQQ